MNALVVGAYWGDEGKGKIVDLLAANSDWVVRYNGGDNAGHTIVVGDKKIVLHVLPSGALQGKNVAIGPDVFFNPASFLKDLNHVRESGFSPGKIVVDERAHVIMPYHIKLEGEKIGTTKRGIGPAAQDKANRTTDVTVFDMTSPDFLKKIKEVVNEKEAQLTAAGILGKNFDAETYCRRIYEVYSAYAARIRQYAGNVSYMLNEEIKKGSSVLLEGAQGSLLDVVHGTRPHVTSSNTIAGGAAANLGIDLRPFKIIGIVKAYPTRVGEGLFVTELGNYEDTKNEERNKPLTIAEKKSVVEGNEKLLGRWIRMDGAEYGATTGRPRRVGFPDFVALKYAAMINGINEWAITKIDVLGGKAFKAAIAYKKGTSITERFPFKLEGYEAVYGQTEYFWPSMTEGQCKAAVSEGYDALPKGMKQYIKELVRHTGIPVRMISLSPERDITLINGVFERTVEYLRK
ncbi:adenylosuccinate synthetase [Candidatus Woesearchaeota archaeon]|nr:adenylosuccinate synthetase [Candidatus Woesearchaeota archaeon]